MGLMINTNTTSMVSQRHLANNSSNLTQSFERLSSGLRINSAADDAAGMNIATKLTAQVKGLNQAARNVNDTSSLLKTAESALSETNNLLQRLRELSVQAGNDTNTAADRQALQSETNQLLSEVDRVAAQVQYNGQTLLDGSFASKSFQIGANSGQTLSVSVKSAKTSDLGNTSTATGDVAAAAGQRSAGFVDANVMTAGQITINGIASADVGATAAADDTFSSVSNDTSAIAKAAAINKVAATTGVTATATASEYTGLATVANAADVLIADNDITINGVGVTFTGGSQTILQNDSNGVLETAINAITSKTGVTADVVGNKMQLTAADGRNIQVVTTTNGDLAMDNSTAATTTTIRGGISLSSNVVNSNGSPAFSVGESAGAELELLGMTGAGTLASTATGNNIATVSLSSASAAATTVGLVDTAIAQVASSRSDIGALLNRLDSASNTLKIASENTSAARSSIQDVDFASETASFSKNQILQQASSSMLAQANVSGQLALSLLGFG